MTVLLTTLNAKYIHTNLAIRLLYGLNQDFPGLAWKEFTLKEDKAAIAAFCRDFDVVAFSCYIWNISPTLEVARRIKALNPAVKILLGGPEVSYDWQEIIARDEVDFIITGEGETPFRAFLYAYPNLDGIPNLIRKTDAGVLYFPKTEAFDLIQYQHLMPYRFDPPETIAHRIMYVETSRGCPYKCEFCLASLDNKVRYLPDAHIKATLLYLMQHGRVIKFLDRTFNIKRDFTLDIFKFILENHRPENVFQFEITADILHPDLVRFIQEQVPPGLFRFEIGIQTVNQKANLEVSRKQDFEKTKAIVEALSHKVDMHLDLIVGLPLDYWEDIRYSFEETFKLFAPELQLGFLKFLKGTPVRYKYEQHGFVFDPEPPYQIIESRYLSRAQLHDLTLLEHALELYWNKKRAVHTLKYATGVYGIFDFLLGLGRYFAAEKDPVAHTLDDVYGALWAYARQAFPDDSVLHELIGIDYYLFHKIRPRAMFLGEVERAEKYALLDRLKLNPNQFRYRVLPLSFDFGVFERENTIRQTPGLLIIQYCGRKKPEVLQVPAASKALTGL